MELQKGSAYTPPAQAKAAAQPAGKQATAPAKSAAQAGAIPGQRTGVDYKKIVWRDIKGNPFGAASGFNVITFDDANNIVDSEGAMAIAGNFVSPRGLSIGLSQQGQTNKRLAYSPDLVRLLVGGDAQISGVVSVVGHVVGDGRYNVSTGSTYFIGKDGTPTQKNTLEQLYAAEGGSPYWVPAERDNHYLVPVYDVPRYIPAERIDANLPRFFADAQKSISAQAAKINALPANGTVEKKGSERVLHGTDKKQNVFVIDVSKDGIIEHQLRFDTPKGSMNIVKVLTGSTAYLRVGRWGSEDLAEHTLYTFPQATRIRMEEPGAIWGSVLAPDATLDVTTTGGNINGNAALQSFFVAPTSGFEFHWHPLDAAVVLDAVDVIPIEPPIGTLPETKPPVDIRPPIWSFPDILPPLGPLPPRPTPKPPIGEILPPPRPTPKPKPKPPIGEILPPPRPMPTPKPPSVIVNPIAPIPVPVCPEGPAGPIAANRIAGQVCPCLCECVPCQCMCWELCVCCIEDGCVHQVECIQVKLEDTFHFEAPYDACYVLRVRPLNAHSRRYKPRIVLSNVGVMEISIEYLF